MFSTRILLILSVFLSLSACQVNSNKGEKFVKSFIEFLNSLPDQHYFYDQGVLLFLVKTNENSYNFECAVKASLTNDAPSVHLLQCAATVTEDGDAITFAPEKDYCHEVGAESGGVEPIDEFVVEEVIANSTETPFNQETAVHLDSEVQTSTGVTSGEQFVAVRREDPGSPCIGCASHVDLQAAGVKEIAELGVRHLDRHEPNVKHTLDSVIDVERTVQVVNGVRYVLTMKISFNNCTLPEEDMCSWDKICKISILEKPWVRMPDKSKYRAIVANNCTEEWQFGDNGEVITRDDNNNAAGPNGDNEVVSNKSNRPENDDTIKFIKNSDLQSSVITEKILTEDEIKDIEGQIVPKKAVAYNLHVEAVMKNKKGNENEIDDRPKTDASFISEDKKKAIDDLLNFFDGTNVKVQPDKVETPLSRIKRSYENDLKMQNIVTKFKNIKMHMNRANYIEVLTQSIVDYANEVDMEIKNRVLNEVVSAEEEFEGAQSFFYIRARVLIPCDKNDCKKSDKVTQLCSGIVDASDPVNPQVLDAFCNIENKRSVLGKTSRIPLDDPLLLDFIQECIKKIETETAPTNALKIQEVSEAYVQRVSGTLTRVSVQLAYTNCSKYISLSQRSNCIQLKELGTKVCQLERHEKHWLHQKQITYTCTEKPIGQNFLDAKSKDESTDNPAIQEIVEEALQYLEHQSNINKKQKIIRIRSAKKQYVSGVLTKVHFEVGYTTCSNDKQVELSACDLLESEPVRSCKVEVWERPWLQDGRQFEVHCDELKSPIRNQIPKKRMRRAVGTNLVGGGVSRDPNDPQYLEYAVKSLHEYQSTLETPQQILVERVNEVTDQVVSGKLTKINFDASVVGSNEILKCNSSVWSRPWLKENPEEITVECTPINHNPTKRDVEQVDDLADNDDTDSKANTNSIVVGGKKEVDSNDPKYIALAKESLQKFIDSSGIRKPLQVVRVKNVTLQVVAGQLTFIEFEVSPTDTNELIICHSKIWERIWLNSKKITIDCNLKNSTSKNDFHKEKSISEDKLTNHKKKAYLDGKEKQDPRKVEYKILAQKSLDKFLSLEKNTNKHFVKEVHSVLTKIVSGIWYEIDFVAIPSSCLNVKKNSCGVDKELTCHSKIWARPWSLEKEIDVDCKHGTSKSPNNAEISINPNVDQIEMPEKTLTYTENDLESSLERIGKESSVNERGKRQDDEIIDDETANYYAQLSVQSLNDHSDTHNLYKLITVHSHRPGFHMGTHVVRMYIETALTYCLRHEEGIELDACDELEGLSHRLCFCRIFPSDDDELVVKQVSVVCDDDKQFGRLSGLSKQKLLTATLKEIEKNPEVKYKTMNVGELDVVPSLDYRYPNQLQLVIGISNCTKDVDINKFDALCAFDKKLPTSRCKSFVWQTPNSNEVSRVEVNCKTNPTRVRRDVTLNTKKEDDILIQKLVRESLEKLELSSVYKYKQKVLQINSYSTKIVTGKETTIDFDVGYTSCLKYEWIENMTACDLLEHLPRKHCVSHIYERLWIQNGRQIEVSCEDDEIPLEAHIDFDNANNAMALAKEALKHIEAKYPHPRRQKVVRVFSLEKQVVAGLHYRLKLEVGFTDCPALSLKQDCKLVDDIATNRFCRVNVWLRTWTEHPPSYRVSCDYQEHNTGDLFLHVQAEALFHDFITTYKPAYIDDHRQMMKRFDVFKTNVRKIHEMNVHERGTATYGVTRFADLTYEEFSQSFLGLKPSMKVANHIPMPQAEIPLVELPTEFDWREYGAVTPVKDQGSCGSCWAFSVTGNIEGQWKIQSGELLSLSEQELVDCDSLDNGCNGGLPDNAYRSIEKIGGLELENDYPYEGENDTCSFHKEMAKVKISGAVNITSNETDMAKWLVANGPISIGINANAMQFYTGGVSHPWKILCNPTNLDHGVLIVGYGIREYPLFHKKLPYWIVKNSWGPSWGLQGYYQVYRGDGTCGVNQMASSAVI